MNSGGSGTFSDPSKKLPRLCTLQILLVGTCALISIIVDGYPWLTFLMQIGTPCMQDQARDARADADEDAIIRRSLGDLKYGRVLLIYTMHVKLLAKS